MSEPLTALFSTNTADTMSMVSSASSFQFNTSQLHSPANDKKVTQLVEKMLTFAPDPSLSVPLSPTFTDPFHWDQCSPDEMLVVKETLLNPFLEFTFTSPLPKTPHFVVADVWFLVVRYGVYYEPPDYLHLFFTTLFQKWVAKKDSIASDVTKAVYWFLTFYRFMHFFKRDPKVFLSLESTWYSEGMQQLQSMYAHVLKVLNHQLDKFIQPFFNVSKPRRWTKLFGLPQPSTMQGPNASISPALVFLSAFLQILQFYQVHGSIVYQLYLHIFTYFNFQFHWQFSMLPSHSRTLALQWRMQWSQLEAWAQHHAYLSPNKDLFLDTLTPFTGLLQFLHIWSQWTTLEQVFDLTKTLAIWKPILKRVFSNYQFEQEELETKSLYQEVMTWLEMEPDTIPTQWQHVNLELPPGFGEAPSEQDWLEAPEQPVEDRPWVTTEWVEFLKKLSS